MDRFGLAFLQPYIVGVEIGSAALKLVGLRISQSNPMLTFYALVPLPENCGDEYIADTIEKILKKHSVTSKDFVLALSGDSLIMRRLELPHMAHNEIPDALRWQIKDLAHFEAENASFTFKIMGEEHREDGTRVIEVLFAAASREATDKNIDIMRRVGMTAVSMNALAFGLEEVVKIHEDPELAKTVMIADIGYSKTDVSIFKNKSLEFVREIPVGCGDLAKALRNGVVTQTKRSEMSLESAIDIMNSIGVPYEESETEDGLTSAQALAFMRPILERLTKEIKRSFNYYAEEYDERVLSAVYTLGAGTKVKNLNRYIAEELNVPASVLTMPKAINTASADLKREDEPMIISLAGVVLGYKRSAHLLPHEYRMEKAEFIEKISLRVVAIITTAILLVSFFFIKLKVDNYADRLKNLRFQKTILSQVNDLQDKVDEKEKLLYAIKKSNVSFDKIMKELSSVIPRDVVLSNMNINQSIKSLDMSGTVYGPRGVAEQTLTRFMENIEKSGYFKEAELVSIQSGKSSSKEDIATFRISCLLE